MGFNIANLTHLPPEQILQIGELAESEPWRFFIPNKPQADFIKVVGSSVPNKRIFLMTSGNGTGKTTATINMIANIVWPNTSIFEDITDHDTGETYTGFFDYPLFNSFPRKWPKNIWYVSNKDSLKAIWTEFQNWIPDGHMNASKGGKSFVSEVAFAESKWRLSFKTVDQDPKTFESANVSIIIFDEPPPLNLYRAAVSRLRKGGIMIIPATPLFSAAWFVDEIIGKVKEDGDKVHQVVSVWDNCIEKCGHWYLGPLYGYHFKGNLHEHDIDFMIRNFDPDEREARVNGVFQYLSGLIYKTYVRENHLVKLKPIQDPKQYVYQFILDPHDRRPPAAMWVRIDKWNRKRVIREWPSRIDQCYQGRPFKDIKSADPYVVDDFVRMWCEIEEELKIPQERMQSIIDPNFGRKPNRITGKLLFEEYEEIFRAHGRPRSFVTNAVDDLATGHSAVKDLLKPTPEGWYRLLVDDSCYNTDWCFRSYSYEPEPTGKMAEKRDISIKVKEIGKDFVDLVRYAAVVNYDWFPLPPLPDYGYVDDYGYEKDSDPEIFRGKGADFV